MYRLVCACIAAVSWVNVAYSEETTLGWMNLDQCRTVEWNNDGFLGTPSPTYREAEQRAYLTISYNATSPGQVAGGVKNCGERGVAAASLASLITNLSAAAPTFWAVFGECMGDMYDEITNVSLKTDSECLW
jgi:hypothetical protein